MSQAPGRGQSNFSLDRDPPSRTSVIGVLGEGLGGAEVNVALDAHITGEANRIQGRKART